MRPLHQVVAKNAAQTLRVSFIALATLALVSLAQSGSARAGSSEMPAIAFDLSSEPVLEAIEVLESSSDAKCHSSASRFEDFLFGTPLSKQARQEQFELQKRWVHGIWSKASSAARQAGETSVAPHHLQPLIDKLVDRQVGPEGQLYIHFSGMAPIEIPKVRAEQYASIAFSLRAILAAQQDAMISGTDSLLILTPDGVNLLHESLDAVTLSALLLGDQGARENNDFEITPAGLQAAWQSLVPGLPLSPTESPLLPDENRPDERVGRAQVLALLDSLVERKTTAYRAYNDLGREDAEALFLNNIERFYARTPLPRKQSERRKITSTLNAKLDDFTTALLLEASSNARRAGHRLIRAVDANRAVQRLLPHQIDEFEDVHLFTRLASEEHVTLEAYDCDSFRDFGTHWLSLKRAAHAVPEETRLPDPLAVEILAETVSQYGVLLLRMAGTIAGQDSDNVRIQAEDLAPGAELIAARARRHRAAPERPERQSHIVSAGANAESEVSDGRDTFFTDVTSDWGIEFAHRTSLWLGEFRHKQLQTPPTFSGGGVAAEDVNGDSQMDLLFVGGIGNALLINDGEGHFRDVTEQAGIVLKRPDGSHGEARNPIIADFDNDGRQDILISYVDDDHQLYRNLGGIRFENVTSRAGLGGKGLVGGPLTVFDFDGDGLLDVYIGYFGDYLAGAIPTFDRDNLNALPNKLFRNLGDMRFADVTEASGVDSRSWTQALSHVDFDRDGRQDIIVANDYGRNAFYRNLGGGKFENVAPELGVTKAYHSMNVGISDLNDDGFPDIYISNLATLMKDNRYVFPDVNTPLDLNLRALTGMLIKESDMLYMSETHDGQLHVYQPSKDVERGTTSTGWAWDADFFDFDHDGDDDLYLVNGTNDYNFLTLVYNRPADESGTTSQHLLSHSRESNVFFRNQDGKLKNVSSQSGADFVGNSRSAAYLDFDGDGDLDIALNNFHGKALLFRNNTEKRELNWLKLRLIGDPERGSNRDAIGARILVTAEGGLRVHREIHGGSGYMSMNPKQQHFGLGKAESVRVEIIWPNGEEQSLDGVRANRSYHVHQGSGLLPDVASRAISAGQ